MAGSDDTVYRGFYDTPHIQDRLRKYSQDEAVFQLLALRQVNPLSILTVISEKFGVIPANMVTDWRFRYQEFDELPYTFTLQAASDQPTSAELIDTIKLTNSAAAGLNTNHRLMSKGTFVANEVTAHTDISTTFDATDEPLNEILKVHRIEAEDSYGTGYTKVHVKRAYPATSITGQAPAIPDETELILVNSVARTNQRPNPPITQNGKYLENLVQITRESYGVGEHMNQGGGIKTFLLNDGAAHLDLNYQLVEMRLMKTIERAALMGRRYGEEVGNESEYETGGIVEWIPASNYINVGGAMTVSRVNNIVSTALDTSGGRELFMFRGSSFTKALASAYENKRGFGEVTELSMRYGLKVYSIEGTGRDGIIYYANAPILSELGMDSQALILNLTEYNYGEKNQYGAFQFAEKVPIKDKPEDADSYDSNAGFMGKWREMYYAWGLIRRLQGTHFRVYGLTT